MVQSIPAPEGVLGVRSSDAARENGTGGFGAEQEPDASSSGLEPLSEDTAAHSRDPGHQGGAQQLAGAQLRDRGAAPGGVSLQGVSARHARLDTDGAKMAATAKTGSLETPREGVHHQTAFGSPLNILPGLPQGFVDDERGSATSLPGQHASASRASAAAPAVTGSGREEKSAGMLAEQQSQTVDSSSQGGSPLDNSPSPAAAADRRHATSTVEAGENAFAVAPQDGDLAWAGRSVLQSFVAAIYDIIAHSMAPVHIVSDGMIDLNIAAFW